MIEEECLSSMVVKTVLWAPGWEESVDLNNNGHASASLASKEKRNFTETERQLIHKGMDLVVGIPDQKVSNMPDYVNLLTTPIASYTTMHCIVRRTKGSVEKITIQKENEPNAPILLQAEKSTKIKDAVWIITSPICDIGECIVYNGGKQSFYCVLNDFEEVAVKFKTNSKAPNLSALDVILPALVRDSGSRTPIHYTGNSSFLVSQANAEKMSADCVRISSKEPQKKDNRYVLMFNGRVKSASKKNFILILPSMPTRDLLLCGKRADSEYVFDMNWPLSLVQGFAIYLTFFK
ncbi:hypothetical protein TVAG_116270 [Trichomonas vaginalis G3]|uniref:Tubby C-terminal domain-containing protein n=1 Tax=Trichomonas vaginalis (strain ATCC PRA-98 / G3) TaxID=412133 RepID=A2EXR3_TRIV3|nr:phosphatidylinositol binding [Trichomonas vaginalis G3]EAY02573.1 hypothetical protein TVAG_116270 [Trichomonas vaginalis G3]KAI5552036.1 phosphatidylinositol binding [Trichomonas vaginalis G3]|eukprot:XP_001330709.1 hypothetical protein [Trichomonas vaginalis G3]